VYFSSLIDGNIFDTVMHCTLMNFTVPGHTLHLLFYITKLQKLEKENQLQFLFVVKPTTYDRLLIDM